MASQPALACAPFVGGEPPGLRLLMTASSFPAGGDDWRGRFIFDMLEAVARSDALQPAFWGPAGTLPVGVDSALADDDANWLEDMTKRGGVAHLLRTQPLRGGLQAIGLLRRLRRAYRRFDEDGGRRVVHVNWLQNALPLKGLSLPALVTVLGSDLALLRLPGMVSALRRVFGERATLLAPNADWMVAPLQRFFGDVAEVRAMPFGIHPRWFAVSRLPSAAASGEWLVVTRVTRAKLGHLLAWGEGLFGERRTLHLLGPMQEHVELPPWIHYHGPTYPEALAGEWFPRVQGLLTLSTHDEGRPQVMIEAMAAGLPVIASDLPAHRDLLVIEGAGILVEGSKSMNEALSILEVPAKNIAAGIAAQSWAADNICTWNESAKLYVSAYCDLLERN